MHHFYNYANHSNVVRCKLYKLEKSKMMRVRLILTYTVYTISFQSSRTVSTFVTITI